MQIVMFDRQSIFIHGMKVSLQQRIPGVSIQGVSQADELWQKLESYPEALVMLDGEFCYWLLQKTVVQFPDVKVLITATDCNKQWLQEVIHFNVMAIVPRDSGVETFALAVNSTAMGMMFLPGDWRTTPEKDMKDLKSLSARQREILTMLAAGESNKEIGRALNISTGTVKAHLESLYRRLEVKNRTQAAMMLNISS
ncbi:response regulator transcription factor [Escherichia albertii]|uniref:helix-turn-helix transcriptional regulator n=2 Tax=Escherichia albertii TaxID=208962 RepID=UPI0010F63829|nr:response regulator transcription factor [Escherichia albertii]MDN4003153.1 response regulator transcription factor [Escherichia albertii]